MYRECGENEWFRCDAPGTVKMIDATGSGCEPIWLCREHVIEYEQTGAPWVRAEEN